MPDRVNLPGQSADVDCPFFLTERQRTALRLAALGYTDHAAARRMQVATRTVQAHLQSARRVLGAMNTTHAVALAIRHQLIVFDL